MLEMTGLNDVQERIDVRGRCTSVAISDLTPLYEAFVLSDCEGAEHEIFAEEAIAGLSRASLLIELHSLEPDKRDIDGLLNRLSRTHDVRRIVVQEPSPDVFEEPCFLSPQQRDLAMADFRVDPDGWALCEPPTGELRRP